VKRVLIGVGILAFVFVSLLVGRWLNTDSVERGKVVELLRAQARGDAQGMLKRLHCPDAACIRQARDNAGKLRAPGEVKIAFYEPATAHALTSRTKTARVVWITPHRLTTVQCVLVRRDGNALAGASITLLRISAPIGREASCP